MDAAMMSGLESSSWCELVAMGAKYMISVEVIEE